MPGKKNISELGEFGFIKKLRRAFDDIPSSTVGIGDDCAVLGAPAGFKLLCTTDMLVEGVHFTSQTPAPAIGRKALAASISDIAAMGGIPSFALVSLGVKKRTPLTVLNGLYKGIRALAKKYDIGIVGGDTVLSKELIINIAMLGKAKNHEIIYRHGAKPGDQIFITGSLGNSLKTKHHLTFTPRVKEASFLAKYCKPSAMIDVSDGLAADLGHILEESGVGAHLFERKVPLRRGATITNALYDGEDFELLFTLNKKMAGKILKLKGNRYFHIGEINALKGKLSIIGMSGKKRAVPLKGYTHF